MNSLKAEVYLSIAQSLDAIKEVASNYGYRTSIAHLSMRDGTEQIIRQNEGEEEKVFKRRIVKSVKPALVADFRFETVIAQPEFDELGIS